MADGPTISAYLQRRLHQLGLYEVTAVDAAAWLDAAGDLKDSASRPGKAPTRPIAGRQDRPRPTAPFHG